MVPNEVPILTMRQIHTRKLGSPYSSCIKEEDHSLMYYQNYTKGSGLLQYFKCSNMNRMIYDTWAISYVMGNMLYLLNPLISAMLL